MSRRTRSSVMATVVGGHSVAHPLPDLGSADLGGGGVLHQVVDGRRALATEPGREIPDADRDVGAQTRSR
jgi:hypothetical protein